MSRLVHYCDTCTHEEVNHDRRRAAYTRRCECCISESPTLNPEPVLIETYALRGGQPEPLHQPGTEYNPGTGHRQHLCNCDRCHEKAAEVAS